MKENLITGGRYLVLNQIGRGGSSEVFKVKDLKTGKEYAMKKYITSDPLNQNQLVKNIEGELKVLHNVLHPVLPQIYNIIKEENDFFLIMEYVEGINLKDVVESKGVLSQRQLLSIMEQVCSGLYYLHSLEPAIVYRDLKPSNIILKNDGKIKLIDFGIAKRYSKEILYDAGAFGTKGFAAPEQFGDRDGKSIYNTDIRSDIYGIGTTMFFLLTGKIYCSNKKMSLLYIPRKFQKVIKKCTKIKPSERYKNSLYVLCALICIKESIIHRIIYPYLKCRTKKK